MAQVKELQEPLTASMAQGGWSSDIAVAGNISRGQTTRLQIDSAWYVLRDRSEHLKAQGRVKNMNVRRCTNGSIIGIWHA
eukprot:scaffold190745_cov27-Prasinocladus_malaysianus.AAC.1